MFQYYCINFYSTKYWIEYINQGYLVLVSRFSWRTCQKILSNLWIIDGKWQFSFVLCMFFFWTWYECNVYAYCTFRLNMPYWNSLLGFICVVLDVLQWKIAIKNPWVKWKTKGRACSHHWVKKILPLFATYIDFRVLDRERESLSV